MVTVGLSDRLMREALGGIGPGRKEEGGRKIGIQPIGNKLSHQINQFLVLEGLYQIGVCSQIVSAVDLGGLAGRTECDDEEAPESRLVANPLKSLESIHPGHFQIQQYEGGDGILAAVQFGFKIANQFLAVANNVDFHMWRGGLEGALQKENIVDVVLSDQD
jgi:hypothetical protein